MSSEWMKVMLDEIARKKSEAAEALAELERRARETVAPSSNKAPTQAASGDTMGRPAARGNSSGGQPPP